MGRLRSAMASSPKLMAPASANPRVGYRRVNEFDNFNMVANTTSKSPAMTTRSQATTRRFPVMGHLDRGRRGARR